MAATVDFIAGSTKESYKYIPKKEKFQCTTKFFGGDFEVFDVSSVELQPMQNTATTGRAVAGAALGGAALGGAGLIAGALIGGKKGEALVTFYFKDGGRALGKCNAPMLEALQVLIFEGRIREGNPYAGLITMEHDEKPVETTPEEESAAPGTAPHKEVTTIPAPPKGMTDEFGNVKAPKKKGSMGKKVVNGIAIVILLCVILAKLGDTEEKTSTEVAPAQVTAPKSVQEDPCAGMTVEKWNNSSSLWKMTNAQCNPEKQKSTPSEALPTISKSKLESYIKKELPAIIKSAEKRHGRDFGSYTIAWPQFGEEKGKTYAVQITFSKSIIEPMAQEMSAGLVLVALKGLENQGMTLKAMEQHGVMVLGGAACKRGGKMVSYGIAAATPADGDDVVWIPQYSIQ